MSQYPESSGGTDTGYPTTPPEQGGGKAIASLVLGIIGMLGWCLPLCGLPLTIVGLILGILDRNGPKRNLAIWGIVLCSIGLTLSIINAIIGVIMALSGNHSLVPPP